MPTTINASCSPIPSSGILRTSQWTTALIMLLSALMWMPSAQAALIVDTQTMNSESAVHASSTEDALPIPSRDQALAMRDALRSTLTPAQQTGEVLFQQKERERRLQEGDAVQSPPNPDREWAKTPLHSGGVPRAHDGMRTNTGTSEGLPSITVQNQTVATVNVADERSRFLPIGKPTVPDDPRPWEKLHHAPRHAHKNVPKSTVPTAKPANG